MLSASFPTPMERVGFRPSATFTARMESSTANFSAAKCSKCSSSKRKR